MTFEELDIFSDPDNMYIRDEILACCNKLWALKKEYNNDVKVEHDFYLKLFQLSKKKMNNQYHCIVLDEAQDSSLLTLDLILNSQVTGIVCVGDCYQMLYSWRNAVNILDKIEGATEYVLTTSFRVGQSIANLANLLISDLTDTDINMKGFNTKQKIVDKIDRNKPYACLSRTNSSLFEEVINAIEAGKTKLYFEGGFQGYKFNNIRDCYYFSIGFETKNSMLSKFDNYGKMEEYADSSKDIELLSLISMVKKYGAQIPSLVESIEGNTVKSKETSQVIFTTIHKSKGMTFKNMVICNDHMDLADFYKKKFIEEDQDLKQETFKEECCILYVAITRVSGEIELSDNYKEYLVLRHRYISGRVGLQEEDLAI
ncbi:UvrD-helicase domain-containing protein [Clostridium tagluense]|uniref:UvrD-like helicase ATP-binding domain-containing protein n=1 Tax=Clostridium tagluense TaxID=360422 RepID=A0A401ULJ5_9CLOT|nr:UvrD-helicase domain-containing protein [Clostridium tagluense]GCD10402.1 hypothetical protein Ctaglu_20250 [Clostridium tagluense]